MSYRDRLPEPKCTHARKGIVTAGGLDGPHAATNVCDRDECIEDAIEWAQIRTGLPAAHFPDKAPEPSLFDEGTWV